MQPIVSPYKQFRFVAHHFDRTTGEAVLTYAFDDVITFTERVTFPLPTRIVADDATLERALFALHLVAGTSYYKAGLPPEIAIECGALTKSEADFWNTLYTLGLGEFFYRNNLAFHGYVNFPATATAAPVLLTIQTDGILLPLGGGKDSLVSVELLRNAGKDFTLFALGTHALLDRVAAAVGASLSVVRRELDPQLFALNKQGAWNGHVPISSYFAFTAVFFALLHGKRDVVLSNEKSANVGNVTVDGVMINHQYSKSLAFEKDVQAYIASSITKDVRYFSVLRPLSELAIVERFVRTGKYFDVFSSCNRNFRITSHTDKLWCGECPKCAFVFALLAAFMPKAQLVPLFGKNLYDDATLLWLYKELLGIDGIKPFECVGEPDEVFAAMVLAQRRGDFAGAVIMDWFTREVLSTKDNADDVAAGALEPAVAHAMPPEYAALVYAAQ